MSSTHIPASIPRSGKITSVVLEITTSAILAICLTNRVGAIGSWKRLPLANWLIFLIYCDSILFVFFTAIVSNGFGVNKSKLVCEWAILLCLICYMTTKVMIYLLLVEKAYIVRGSRQRRMKDRLYLINFFGMICPYVVVIVLNFVFRIAYINEKGQCIIGMEKVAMIPLIGFEVLVNVYLTALFILPLRRLWSYKNSESNSNTALRTIAIRTFIGSCATLTSSVVNLTVLMVLEGEPGWICLICCNADILFAVLILHWVTAMDTTKTRSKNRSYAGPQADLTNNSTAQSRRRATSGPMDLVKRGKNEGCVTTVIERDYNVDTRDFPLSSIKVTTAQVREVDELEARSETSGKTTEGKADSQGENGSTDKIVAV